jgi:hypothetical protein
VDARISHDINLALRRQPGLLHWWMTLRDLASKALREARFVEHVTNEDLYEEIRAKAEGKLTETAVKMAVNRHPKMRKAYRDRMGAKDALERLESAVHAIQERGRCLHPLAKSEVFERSVKDSV